MEKFISFLRGKKTFLFSACGIVIVGAYGMGYIPEALANQLMFLIGFSGMASLRAALNP